MFRVALNVVSSTASEDPRFYNTLTNPLQVDDDRVLVIGHILEQHYVSLIPTDDALQVAAPTVQETRIGADDGGQPVHGSPVHTSQLPREERECVTAELTEVIDSNPSLDSAALAQPPEDGDGCALTTERGGSRKRKQAERHL